MFNHISVRRDIRLDDMHSFLPFVHTFAKVENVWGKPSSMHISQQYVRENCGWTCDMFWKRWLVWVSFVLFFFYFVDTPQSSPHHLNLSNASGSKSSNIPNSISNFQIQQTPNNGNVPTVRIRKLSNSSMASDVSFRLPSFDTSTSAYSFQSDLDASASEFEDSASTFGYEAQLDVISKERLYGAYKKTLERYQKYRSRYSELVRRYRDLERDNNKARVTAHLIYSETQ